MLMFAVGFCAALALAGVLGVVLTLRLRRELARAAAQAQGLLDGHYAELDAPTNERLGVVVAALNATLRRWRDALAERAAELDDLRRRANLDALTGLFQRGHFSAEPPSSAKMFALRRPAAGVISTR
jgi:hypothetical protein